MAGHGQDIGEQIMEMVDAALHAKSFDKLNQQISELLNPGGNNYRPLDHMTQNKTGQRKNAGIYRNPYSGLGEQQKRAQSGAFAGREAYNARKKSMMEGQPHDTAMGVRPAAAQKASPYFGEAKGETLGKILTVIGIIALGINGISFAGGILFGSAGLAELIAGLIRLGISGAVFLTGQAYENRAKRFKKYVSGLKDKLYAAVSDLGRLVGKKEDYVQKDLQKMIDAGMFPQGHLDDAKSTMIASDAIYAQYRATQKRSEELQKEKEAIEAQYGALNSDVRKVLEQGEEYVKKIRTVNAALPEEQITEKLNRLENVITKIFARVKEAPEEAKNLSQFMDYYLPTTFKLVSAYQDMESQPVQGENITKTKQEIMESLDTISDAYETLLDSMFKDQAWDVQTDISVMKSMMKQDGLTGKDFKASGGVAMAMPKDLQVKREEK